MEKTPQEILYNNVMPVSNVQTSDWSSFWDLIKAVTIKSMQEYADQQTQALKEEKKELLNHLKLMTEQFEGIAGYGDPTDNSIIDKAQQLIKKHDG